MGRGHRRILLLAVLTGTALLARSAGAKTVQPCPGGRFVVDAADAPVLGPAAPESSALEIGSSGLTLGGCGATHLHRRVAKRFTSIRGTWRRCGTLGTVRLRGRIAPPACDVVRGIVRQANHRAAAFSASRRSPGGPPIDAPPETWTWVPIAGSMCADGSPTGIGVNLTGRSARVLIFLVGGGACWDEVTCYTLHTASHIEDGYGEAAFASDIASSGASGLFDRDDPRNPFRDWSFVLVPYCTGDVHAGAHVAEYGGRTTRHVGAANVASALPRLVATFPDVERVVLSGTSAGGFGAAYHWGRVHDAFSPVRVDLIDDSGPPLPPPYTKSALLQAWYGAWRPVFPADCATCETRADALLDYWGPRHPSCRAAFLDHTHDAVIGFFFQLSASDVASGLDALAGATLSRWPNYRYFFVDGAAHGLLGNPDGVSQDGVILVDWLRRMESDSASWHDVHP